MRRGRCIGEIKGKAASDETGRSACRSHGEPRRDMVIVTGIMSQAGYTMTGALCVQCLETLQGAWT
jgi:hypothetical protein